MHVETFSVGVLGCNCSIVADLESKRAIVVDPGGDFDEIRAPEKHLVVLKGAGHGAIFMRHEEFLNALLAYATRLGSR